MTPRKPLRRTLAAALVAAGLVSGCIGIGRGGDRVGALAEAYRAGRLPLEAEALAAVEGGVPGVDVYLSLPAASLVFRPAGEGAEAVVQWEVTVEREGGGTVATFTPADTVRAPGAEAASEADPVTRRFRVDAPPGAYRVRAVAEAVGSERFGADEERVEVPRPTTAPAVGGLRLEGAYPSGRVGPLVAFSVPAGIDSLGLVAQALAPPPGAVLSLALGRYRADTTAASPLGAFTPPPTSLAARGIDFGGYDSVATVRQPVAPVGGVADVRLPLPRLRAGVYRATLDLLGPDGRRLDRASRLVVVRRRDYPRVTRIGDLVDPLVYLAEPDELRRLRAAVGTPGARRAFDRFWGEQIDDRRVAAATLRAFYERVEEANRLFGSHKEGWKTDPGMVYVLFGPPLYADRTPTGEVWSYGSGGAAPTALVFEQTAGRPGDPSPVSVLTLVRDRRYHDAWLNAQRLWRTGRVP